MLLKFYISTKYQYDLYNKIKFTSLLSLTNNHAFYFGQLSSLNQIIQTQDPCQNLPIAL